MSLSNLSTNYSEQSISTTNNLEIITSATKSFTDICKIGKGSFGSVYKVKNVLDDNEYALKKIKLSENTSINILNEIRILAKLDHKNIVRYYNAWIDVDYFNDDISDSESDCSTEETQLIKYNQVNENNNICLFIQMKLYPITLEEWIHNKKDPNNMDSIVKQLFSGIKFLHDNNIVHRDLKPCNIFIDYDNKIKIGDFGLARYIGSKYSINDGSYLYRPEKEYEDPKFCDIYALAIILIELILDFKTGSERYVCLKNVKKGIIDERLKQSKYYLIIKEILDGNYKC